MCWCVCINKSDHTSIHLAELVEADVLGVLAEALPAHLQAVLPDQAVGVVTHTAGVALLAVLLRVRVPHSGASHFL